MTTTYGNRDKAQLEMVAPLTVTRDGLLIGSKWGNSLGLGLIVLDEASRGLRSELLDVLNEALLTPKKGAPTVGTPAVGSPAVGSPASPSPAPITRRNDPPFVAPVSVSNGAERLAMAVVKEENLAIETERCRDEQEFLRKYLADKDKMPPPVPAAPLSSGASVAAEPNPWSVRPPVAKTMRRPRVLSQRQFYTGLNVAKRWCFDDSSAIEFFQTQGRLAAEGSAVAEAYLEILKEVIADYKRHLKASKETAKESFTVKAPAKAKKSSAKKASSKVGRAKP